MKIVRNLGLVLALSLVLALPWALGLAQEDALPQIAAPLSSAFTYQGYLAQGGAPAGGSYDFVFTLFDSPTAISELASISLTNVQVSGGYFSVLLDYGFDLFLGEGRWLEVKVRGSAGGGTYTVLSPRQALTSAPYALYARSIDTAYTDGYYWRLGGISLSGTGILGTTNNHALDILVNNSRALRLEPHATSPNLIGGHSGNWITEGVYGASIGGGGESGFLNLVTDNFGKVGGGRNNQAGDNAGTVGDRPFATVGGGSSNQASGGRSTVGGGWNNQASGISSKVGGGASNQASGGYSTVGGGWSNEASGINSTIPGGILNSAAGDYSFAAGRQAKANHTGSFVWGGGMAADVASPADNTYSVRASGGIWLGTTNTPSIPAGRFINTSTGAYLTTGGVWTNSSDRDVKENFAPVDPQQVLKQVTALPITTWNYLSQDASIRHLGPMAQDFYAAFGLGQEETSIATIDIDGVALAAIQGLADIAKEQAERIDQLEGEVAGLEARLAALEARLDSGSSPSTSLGGLGLFGMALAGMVFVYSRKPGVKQR
jgi:trimeric autotransporter adhesin